MKKLLPLLLIGSTALLVAADEPAKKEAAPAKAEAAKGVAAKLLSATAPFVNKDGELTQAEQKDLTDGGKATFEFTVEKDGQYELVAVVKAPDEDQNSFFINIDAVPEDPVMIWDIDVTAGYEERVVSWRGTNGDANNDEIKPKRFKLTAGKHKINLVGREPCSLKTITVRLVPG